MIDKWGSVAAFCNCSVVLFRYDRLSLYHLHPLARTRLHEVEENIETWGTYLCAPNRVWFTGENTTLPHLPILVWVVIFNRFLCGCSGWCLVVSPIRVNKTPVLNGVLHVLMYSDWLLSSKDFTHSIQSSLIMSVLIIFFLLISFNYISVCFFTPITIFFYYTYVSHYIKYTAYVRYFP